MRKLTLVSASVLTTVLLVGAGTASAAESPPRTPLVDGVAARLGVTPDQLRAAFKATLVERVDRAVAAGRLTPERAARIKERIADAEVIGRGARAALAKKAEAFKRSVIARSKQSGPVAELLKMRRAEIWAQLRAGKSLAEIAAAQGVSKSALIAAIVEPAKERVAKAVAAGKLSQPRADELMKRLTERIAKLVDVKRPPAA